MGLKASLKFESVEQLRCAHGMCPSPAPLTWKKVWRALSYGRWVTLLKTNPRRWNWQIRVWIFENEIADKLADEIRKEIDNEIIQQLAALASETGPTTA